MLYRVDRSICVSMSMVMFLRFSLHLTSEWCVFSSKDPIGGH